MKTLTVSIFIAIPIIIGLSVLMWSILNAYYKAKAKKEKFRNSLLLSGFSHKITSYNEFKFIGNFAQYLKNEFDLIIKEINK